MAVVAAARVDTRIRILGEDRASGAIKSTRKSLQALDNQAANAKGVNTLGDSFAKLNTEAGEGSKNTKEALEGVREVLGGISPELGVIATGFGGVEKFTKALPGPIGLFAAGITAAVGGSILLAKHLGESAAKIRFLGGKDAAKLKDELNLSADGAVKLSQSLDQLENDALRPSLQTLTQIRDQAQAMGLDGAEAMAAYADAIRGGDEALKAFERRFGSVNAKAATLEATARALGLDVDLLGLSKRVKDADKLTKALELQRKITQQQAADEATVARLRARAANSVELTGRERARLLAEANELELKTIELRGKATEKTREDITAINARLALVKGVAVEEQQRATRIAILESRIKLTTDEQQKSRLQLLITQEKQEAVAFKQDILAKNAANLSERELIAERGKLFLMQQQERIRQQSLADARRAEEIRKREAARQKARAAAQRAATMRDAELQAEIRLQKAHLKSIDDTISGQTQRTKLSLDLLNLEEKRALAAAARAVNTEQGKFTAQAAIAQEFANKRAAILKAPEKDLAKFLEDSAKRSAKIRADVATNIGAIEIQALQRRASAAQESGNVEVAAALRRQLAQKTYATTVAAINTDIETRQKGLNAASDDFHRLEQERIARTTEAQERLNGELSRLSNQRESILRESALQAAEAIQGPAQMLGDSPLGAGLAAASAGITKVANDWKSLKQSASGAISAAGGVAAAFVKGEKEKAAVLAVMETAAAIAAGASGNIPGAVAHGAAAALYAGIAAGAISTSAPSATTPTVPTTANEPGIANGGGGQTVNVFLGSGFAVGTSQEIGAAINGAVASLSGTGMATQGI